jgi:hypothetical protein
MWFYVFLCGIALFLYGLGFMFLMGSSPGHHPALDAFIKSTLGSGESTMLSSVLTFGYVKASFRRFFATYRAYATVFIAEEGKRAPSARVVKLDGVNTNLSTIFEALPVDMPIVLNMGSYT